MNKYIITFDGFHKKVTELQAEYFIAESTTQSRGMQVDGTYIAFSSVSAILDEREYYQTFPDRKPEIKEEYPALGAGGIIRSINHKKALEALLTGLQKAKREHEIQTGKPALNIDALIKKVTFKINQPEHA